MRRSVPVYCEIFVYKLAPKRGISSNLGYRESDTNRDFINCYCGLLGNCDFQLNPEEIFLKA